MEGLEGTAGPKTAQAHQIPGQGVLPRWRPVPRGCLQGAVVCSGACRPDGAGQGPCWAGGFY